MATEMAKANVYAFMAEDGTTRRQPPLVTGDTPASGTTILRNMKLGKIIKENHKAEIHALVVNHAQPSNSNLVATVGGAQANVYDNEHFGTHLDLMCNYDHSKAGKGGLRCAVWVDAGADAQLAVGGEDGNVHIVSLAFQKVESLLEGHTGAVVGVAANPVHKEVIVSCSIDGTARVWNATTAECYAILHVAANCVAFSADGQHVLTGGRDVRAWSLAWLVAAAEPLATRAWAEPVDIALDTSVKYKRPFARSGTSVDAIACVGPRVVVRRGALVEVWDPHRTEGERGEGGEEGALRIGVPSNDVDTKSGFGISPDAQYIACGNSHGVVYVYRLDTGALVTRLQHEKSSAPVTHVQFGARNGTIIHTCGPAMVWRWEFQDPVKAKRLREVFQAQQTELANKERARKKPCP